MSKLLLVGVLVFVAIMAYNPFWMTETWCMDRAKSPQVMVVRLLDSNVRYGLGESEMQRFYVGNFTAFGRHVGIHQASGVIYGGWWVGYMDLFGNIYITLQS